MRLKNTVLKFAKRSGLLGATAILVVSTVFAAVANLTGPQLASAVIVEPTGSGVTPTSTTTTSAINQGTKFPTSTTSSPTTTATSTTTSTSTTAAPSSSSCTPQDTYPLTNVIYCGLSGSTASSLMSSFKTYYSNNNDGHGNTDLQAVYNAAHFNSSMYTSGHWAIGTSYKDGTIVVNGQVVATSVQIASRCYLANMGNCQPPSRYTYLAGKNVYTRDATWFFDTSASSKETLVHIDDTTGGADFALWTGCGNALIFTSKPQPKVLACVDLTADKTNENDTSVSYSFIATASRQYTKITHYDFNFGDSHSQRVDVNDLTTTKASHSYGKTDKDQTFTAKVTVSDATSTVTSANCQVQIKIPAKPKKPPVKSLACVQLDAATGSSDSIRNFTATASAQNTTISSYTFDYGDGSKQTVSTSASTATASHTYAAGNFTARVSVTGPLGTFTADACTAQISVQTPPPPLPNTGPGSVIGIFGATTILGGAFHQFVLRRKLNS